MQRILLPPQDFEAESNGSESIGNRASDSKQSLSRSLSELILPLLFEPVS